MKKRLGQLAIMFGLVCSMVGIVGCDLSKDQIKAIANTSGVMAAVGWVSYDNPSEAQKAEVVAVIKEVKDTVASVTTNSYVTVVYPKIQEIVAKSTKIPDKDKPFVLAGSLALLGGIDIMFASNPKWKADADNVGIYATAFMDGAITGLGYPCDDCVVTAAKRHYAIRSMIKK